MPKLLLICSCEYYKLAETDEAGFTPPHQLNLPLAPTFSRCAILLVCLVEANFEGFYINYLLDYS